MGFDLKAVGRAVSTRFGTLGLKVKSASPELLLGGGIILMGGAVVTAVLAGRKNDEIMDNHAARLEDAKLPGYIAEDGTEVVKSEKEIKTEVRKAYAQTGLELAKNYAPTAALMAGSVGCFVGMHNIQAGRIAGLTSAYTGLQEAYRSYQERNIKMNGFENHQMCKYGTKEITEVDEDGYTVKKTVPKDAKDVAEENVNPDYFFVVNETNSGLSGHTSTDILMLQGVETELRKLVDERGWAIGNDVLDMLKIPRTQAGMVNGWIKGGNEPSIGYLAPINNRFLAGYNHEDVILEFNYDVGNVNAFLQRKEKAEIEVSRKLRDKALKEAKEARA